MTARPVVTEEQRRQLIALLRAELALACAEQRAAGTPPEVLNESLALRLRRLRSMAAGMEMANLVDEVGAQRGDEPRPQPIGE